MLVSVNFGILSFLVSLLISTVIIYIVTKLFGKSEGLGTAVIAALLGSLIYALVLVVLANGFLAALVAGVVWTLALCHLYKVGWIRSILIAAIIWISAAVVGLVLPTLFGPL